MDHTKRSQIELNCPFHEKMGTTEDIDNQGIEYFLQAYFNSAYRFFLCPFNIKKDKLAKHYIAGGSTWFRRILTGLLYFLSLHYVLREICMNIPNNTNNPGNYFRMAHTLIDGVLKFIAVKQFWWDHHDIANIVNYASTFRTPTECVGTSRFISKLVTSITIAVSLYSCVLCPSINFPSSVRIWWEEIVDRGRFNFFLEAEFSDLWSIDSIIIGGLTGIGLVHRRTLGIFTDFLIIMAVLTVHRATKNFTHLLEHEGSTWRHIQGEYEKLKGLVELVNTFMGKNLGYRLIVIILTWAFSIHEIHFLRQNSYGVFSLFMFALYHSANISILFLSADICQQVFCNN